MFSDDSKTMTEHRCLGAFHPRVLGHAAEFMEEGMGKIMHIAMRKEAGVVFLGGVPILTIAESDAVIIGQISEKEE